MKKTIELDKEDIKNAIATAYNVQPQDVSLDLYMTSVGYGMNEHDVPDVRAFISVDLSVRM